MTDNASNGGEVATNPATPTVPSTMAIPWFVALPCMPKFSGKDGEIIKFGTWLEQIEYMLRTQGLPGPQRVHFVLWALEGTAKRQVLLLDAAQRASDRTILAELKGPYVTLTSS